MRRSAKWWLAALALYCVMRVERPSLYEGISWSRAVYARDGQLLRLSLTSDDKYRLFVPLHAMPDTLVDATLVHEDHWFRWHPGVNPFALVRAATSTRRMGGSTLTMQLARIRYGMHTRTVPGKLRQIARAMLLEAFYSKDELLEAYLNLAPYGGNIEGAGAAGLVYFHKTKLSPAESVALAAIPQSPSDRIKRPDALKRAYQRLQREMGVQNDAVLHFHSPRELPKDAPHTVEALLQQAGPRELHTSIDASLQKLIERKVQGFITARRHLGIDNAAVLLMDARSGQVLAEVGSADFNDTAISGQVSGTRAKRSPGSTLKPFIFGLAVDAGLIHGDSLLIDAPERFSGFNPENFERDFAGPLSAREALYRSRNVPAVHLLQQLGGGRLHALLQSAGVQQLKSAEHYGLALALGGAELTMSEVATLYTALANGGVTAPAHRTAEAVAGVRILSPEAAWIVRDMLASSPPLVGTSEKAGAKHVAPVAWKTGTSHGFRDAWTFGVFGPYVLGVWVGRFDGASNPAFVGLRSAAPLFFSLVEGLRHNDPPWSEPTAPTGLTRVEVCSVSGQLPSDACPHRKKTLFIAGVSPIDTCHVHKQVIVDNRSGEIACQFDARTTHLDTFEVWPSHVLRLFERAGLPRRSPPVSHCDHALQSGRAPDIQSPQPELTYLYRGADTLVPLQANVEGTSQRVHWFVGTRYLGASAANEPLDWHPQPGKHVIRAVDALGRASTRQVEVHSYTSIKTERSSPSGSK